MKLKLTIISLFLSITNLSYSFDENQTVKIGPLSINLKYCEMVDKVSAITNSFTNVKWPVQGAVGVTMGVIQRSSVILEFCDYLMRMKSLSTEDGIWASADYLNKLTGNKWDDHLSFTKSTYDMKEVFIDSNNKKRPLSQVLTAQNASRVNSYYKESGDYYDKYIADPNSKLNVRNRNEMERDLSDMTRMSSEKAILSDMVNCPDPGAVSSSVSDKAKSDYDSFVTPANENIAKYTSDLDFYSNALRTMGVKISKNEKEMDAYLSALKDLEARSTSITLDNANMKKESLEKIKNPSKAKGAPKTIEKKTQIDYAYHIYGVNSTSDHLEAFKKKYAPMWKSWVTAQVVQNTFGLLDGPVRRIEDEFKDAEVLCPPSKYLSELQQKSSPESYEKFKAEKHKQCLDEENKKISDSGGLLAFYAERIFDLDKKLKAANASVWTYESKYLDIQRNISGSNLSSVPNQKVSCGSISNVTALQHQGNQINMQLLNQTSKTLELAVDAKIEEDKEKATERDRANELERKTQLEIEADKKVAPVPIESNYSKARLL